ncbi:hypothetical protein ACFL1S_08525 [Pseudomonadota bacterium]
MLFCKSLKQNDVISLSHGRGRWFDPSIAHHPFNVVLYNEIPSPVSGIADLVTYRSLERGQS